MHLDEPSHLESALTASAEELIAGRGGETSTTSAGWEQVLARLSRAATTQVHGAVYAGMTMRETGGRLVSRGPSHPEIVELDRVQADLGEGPCVDALSAGEQRVIRVEDFADEPRWPRFAAAAVASGIGSLLSYAMAPQGAAPGAMNFYATVPRAFADPTARTVAAAFAMQAAIAVYGAGRITQLHRGLENRDLIGRAKGILMERFTLDDQQAFDLLVRSSQDTNVKLLEVARWLTGDVAARAHRTDGSRTTS